MILSLLICHLKDRKEQLAALMAVLEPQKTEDVEILVETDSGEMAIGEKRNVLLDRAQGEYIAYIDDDDMVSDNYVQSILTAVETRPDCVGIEGILYAANAQHVFKHSVQFAGWYQQGGIFYRTPNHLNPVLKKIACMVGFDASLSHGEDHEYSKEIRQYLHTEVCIDHPIYYYNCLHIAFEGKPQ